MSKTITQLSEEYNDWCGKNDIDSFLRTQGFTDRRMLSADELLAQLMLEEDELNTRITVVRSQRSWLRGFTKEWEEAVLKEREEEHAKTHRPHAVFARHHGFGWTSVHNFLTLMQASHYVRGQLQDEQPMFADPSREIKIHQDYNCGDVTFVVSPVEEG